ncbi:hypothetical protein BDZ94DRAFT_1276851 [Collybia nuda]|uniref:Uncharacterized protein n=1 Tax=Collybia nuda TaxID=64659 RepID=A0A9P6C888_9AGAR|nr:hypothetical protein BDZ94DRAFT_1276851 [Collybia nuda]
MHASCLSSTSTPTRATRIHTSTHAGWTQCTSSTLTTTTVTTTIRIPTWTSCHVPSSLARAPTPPRRLPTWHSHHLPHAAPPVSPPFPPPSTPRSPSHPPSSPPSANASPLARSRNSPLPSPCAAPPPIAPSHFCHPTLSVSQASAHPTRFAMPSISTPITSTPSCSPYLRPQPPPTLHSHTRPAHLPLTSTVVVPARQVRRCTSVPSLRPPLLQGDVLSLRVPLTRAPVRV